MSASRAPLPPLCVADAPTFWPFYAWSDLARWPQPAATTVVLPVVGMADWDLGWPLDAEESLAMEILRRASAKKVLGEKRLLVLPPLRFVLGPSDKAVFPVTPEVAHGALAELCASVAASGFTRIVLYNSSPWNEELVDAAARDLRIEKGLQMFIVNLSALGMDLALWRKRDVTALQAAWQEMLTPAAPSPVLEAGAQSLAGLLQEIAQRAPLARHGDLGRVQP